MEEQVHEVESGNVQRQNGAARRLLRVIFRFLVVIVFGIAIGIAAYYGVPALYRDFIEPIRSNTDRIAALEEAVANVQVDFREKHGLLTTDIAGLEGEFAQQREDLSTIAAAEEGFVSQLQDLSLVVDDNQDALGTVEDLEERFQAFDARINSLEERIAQDDPYMQVQTQIQLLRVMELVTRSRFWMIQGNLGEASEDLTSAKVILENLDAETQEVNLLPQIADRLDQVLLEISLNPIIAADDLEIVWQLLLLATEP